MTTSQQPLSERDQTDESLRAERQEADRALEENTDALDETADAIVVRARARADAVLTAARLKTDRSGTGPPPEALERSRTVEDRLIQDERVEADDMLRGERAEHVARLSYERQETDRDLSIERSRSDHALATREEFMGLVSHDLKNMLNAMVGVASLIEKEAARDDHVEQVVAHARRIQRSGARMHRVIGDLVDVASIEAGMMAVTREICDPIPVVIEAVETFQAQASESGVALVAEIVPPLPPVTFDSARILQVLSNLLSNAIKHTPRQGSVLVHVEHVGDEIVFAVRDTGAGIAADRVEATFERFVPVATDDRRGVGLGLYISKCIVQGHAGRIWVDSEHGDGSAFCFTLPVQRGA